ncbi:MAG: response regulator transcription factor, partial [Chloroflexota bacterium]|nr:response regulator transcription factor [Chloroflexota bacterium]
IGLELGADDYVTKPFSPRVVVAKVRAVLRRADTSQNQTQILQRGDLKISLEDHRVTQAEIVVDLTPTEFNLLYTMANHPGRVFSRLQLLESTQGAAYQEYERTIDAHIKNLRSKIEKDPKDPQYIETVFGVGYRFAHSLGQ